MTKHTYLPKVPQLGSGRVLLGLSDIYDCAFFFFLQFHTAASHKNRSKSQDIAKYLTRNLKLTSQL